LGLLPYKVYLIEASGVLTFGAYWFTKTHELKLSSLESDTKGAVQHEAQRKAVEEQAEKHEAL